MQDVARSHGRQGADEPWDPVRIHPPDARRRVDRRAVTRRPDDDDERRRCSRVTRFGRAVAAAEADRLKGAVQQARATGLVPRRS